MRRLDTLATQRITLQSYLQEISKVPRLALDEERALGRRIREADTDALHALVEGNLRFVASYARRYRHLGVALLDLIHEGNQGLLAAARSFDPDRGLAFRTHAKWWVRQSIMHRLADVEVAALEAQVGLPEPPGRDDALPWPAGSPAWWASAAAPRPAAQTTDGSDAAACSTLPAPPLTGMDDDVTREALVRDLEGAMADLDPTERAALRRRYAIDVQPGPLTLAPAAGRPGRWRRSRVEAAAILNLSRRQHLRGLLN